MASGKSSMGAGETHFSKYALLWYLIFFFNHVYILLVLIYINIGTGQNIDLSVLKYEFYIQCYHDYYKK